MLQLPQNPNTFGNGRGALHIAAEDGFLQSLQLLLEAKADKDVTLEIDYTPLHLATRNGHLEDRVRKSREEDASVDVRAAVVQDANSTPSVHSSKRSTTLDNHFSLNHPDIGKN